MTRRRHRRRRSSPLARVEDTDASGSRAPPGGAPAGLDLALRDATPDDRELLYRVYASTRREELAAVPWSGEQKDAFLRMQFDAQDRHYREHYADAAFHVVERHGEPVGRLYVARWPDEIRIVDIALLPEHRGRGIGTALLEALLAEADAAGSGVSIHVERFNRARRLYERLGFAEVEDRGVYLLMKRPPRIR
ncbi:MAG: GNAT family N-acetyltransferase [Gemmatimonadota bacterium]